MAGESGPNPKLLWGTGAARGAPPPAAALGFGGTARLEWEGEQEGEDDAEIGRAHV